MRFVLLFFLLFVPTTTSAALQITEVAWMGSSESANHEWIELYNDGSTLVVDGWTISDGANLSIDLAGTIPTGSYAVLERTSDASAAGSAFLIYTGALVNSGTTLTLRDNVGQVVDQISGGSDWESIGGDNTTKDTAQWTTNGWITAIATPGSGTTGAATPPPVTQDDDKGTAGVIESATDSEQATKTSDKSGGQALILTLPDVTLQLNIVSPVYTHVNQSAQFSVTPSGIGDTLLDSATYTWNFGDGSTAVGQDVVHTFAHPGRYVVVVSGGYKRQQQVARVEIEVLPVELLFETTPDGDVLLRNISDTEIDLSDYRVVGHDTFIFPQYTILLPQQSITIPRSQLGGRVSTMMAALYDPSDQAVAMILPGQVPRDTVLATASPEPILAAASRPVPRISAASDSQVNSLATDVPSGRFAFARTDTLATEQNPFTASVAEAAGGLSSTSQVAQTARAAWAIPGQWPLYTLIGVLLLGMLSIFLIPSHPRGGRRD